MGDALGQACGALRCKKSVSLLDEARYTNHISRPFLVILSAQVFRSADITMVKSNLRKSAHARPKKHTHSAAISNKKSAGKAKRKSHSIPSDVPKRNEP